METPQQVARLPLITQSAFAELAAYSDCATDPAARLAASAALEFEFVRGFI